MSFAARPVTLRSVPSGAQYEPVQQSVLSRKLKVEPGARYRVLNAPAGYLDQVAMPPGGVDDAAEMVLLFASNRAQLEENAAAALRALKPGGALWIAYPNPAQGRSDLNRNHGGSVLGEAGFVPTTSVALDESWDALRFQPAAEVPQAAIPAADMLPVGRHATPVFRVVRTVARALFHLLFRFDVAGRERIPDKAFVVIANHLGWMDAVSLLLLFPPEPRIHFLADPTSMMRNRPLWMLVRATGGIVPVNRARHGDPRLFSHVDRCLKDGGAVALFPEGDFGPREGQLLPFKRGFAHFAVEAGVPVLPVGLGGMKELWLGKRLVIRIGEPILTTGKTVDEVLDSGEKAVNALLPKYVEPPGSKPLRRWLTGLF
jgi:1-acyl-sn-glycerol-3-phosphate acyltransferase